MTVAPAELRILGPTDLSRATRSGGPVLRQPKRLALLAYLALDASDGYRRRDQIVALLWPERDQMHARTQLRKGLHALRGVLGTDAFLTRGEDELRLNADRIWCDAIAFRRHVEAQEWVAALTLYRGDLLEGFHPGGVGPEFEQWLQDQRTSLRALAARAAWGRSALADLHGDRDAAIASAKRAAELSPDDEQSVRRLIATLDRYGDRAGALKLFVAWRSRLRQEFDAEPAPETRKLVRNVGADRKGESSETPSLMRALSLPNRSAPEAATSRPPIEIPGAVAASRRAPRVRRAVLTLGGSALAATIAILGAQRYFSVSAAAVAVIPFSIFGDSSATIVGDGISDEVTTALAQIPGMTVRAAAVARDVARMPADLRELGHRLGVDHVVVGSVTSNGLRIHVTVRLVRIRDETARWARAFDIDPADVIGGQQRIAAATAAGTSAILRRDAAR